MKSDTKFKVSVTSDRLLLDTATAALGATVHLLVGVKPNDTFDTVRQPLVIDEIDPTRCYCTIERGIYLIRAPQSVLALLMPETVQVTVRAAIELLRLEALPPPRILRQEVADEINAALAQGETWASATARLGVGPSGNGSCTGEIQREETNE
jgi:hypothetical protein